MPTLTAETMENIGYQLFRAAGASEGHARTVAHHLADANLAGHDSHGFIRVPGYLQRMKEGHTDPVAQPEIVRETSATAQIDGHRTFGQVTAKFGTETAIQKARESGVSFVTMGNQGHIGRVGAYPEMAANAGMACIMWAGSMGRATRGVAPFGGREGRLGTNPISMAFPCSLGSPVLLDFATSMAAAGKIHVYRARGELLPEEWVLSKEGIPSKDPKDYDDNGALLPIGGLSGGHKGYALSVMVALFGGALASFTSGNLEEMRTIMGCSIVVIDVSKFAPVEELHEEVDGFLRFLKDTPPMQGSSGVLYPGEVEARSRQERSAKGVEIEEATWNEVLKEIREYGLEKELTPLP